MRWETCLQQLARHQDGLVGRYQLPELGYDRGHWHQARHNGRWEPVGDRVIALAGSPPTDSQRVRAAILDVGDGAVLHGPTALAWYGVRGFDLSHIHVAYPRCRRFPRSDLAAVHQLRAVRTRDLCVIRGIPSVTALRAIWSEASRFANERWHEVGLQRIGRVLDDAHRAGLVTWRELHDSVDDLQSRGRSGTRLMRELAAGRLPGSSPTESRLEDRVEEVLAGHDLPTFVRQPWVGGEHRIGRCDFRDPELPLVLEANSLAFHTTPSDQAADERRYTDLVAAGFTVAVLWEVDLWSRPSAVIQTVQVARRRARTGDQGVVHSAGCPWTHDPERIVIGAGGPKLRG